MIFMHQDTHSMNNDIKTHDSELQGQEEAGRTQQMNELFTRMKFVNALNKPPLKLLLSY